MAEISFDLQTMIAEVRSLVAEPAEGFYDDGEITRWLNLAQIDFASRTKLLTTSATANSVAGQKRYQLPGDFLDMLKAFYDNQELTPLDRHELLFRNTRSNLDAQGTVESYYFQGTADAQNCLMLYKVPASIKVVEIWYSQKPPALVNTGDVTIFSAEWANPLILFAAARAHRKQRQLADAREAMAEYLDAVGEAMQRRAMNFQRDIPIQVKHEGIWETKRMRW